MFRKLFKNSKKSKLISLFGTSRSVKKVQYLNSSGPDNKIVQKCVEKVLYILSRIVEFVWYNLLKLVCKIISPVFVLMAPENRNIKLDEGLLLLVVKEGVSL